MPVRFRRLKGKKVIEQLFLSGKSDWNSPVRLVYLIDHETTENELIAGVSVSKRLFKRAIDRNLIKRRMRESLRSSISELNDTHSELKTGIYLMFIYQSNTIESSIKIKKGIKEGLDKILRENSD
jgi:ribonuclease P protein component